MAPDDKSVSLNEIFSWLAQMIKFSDSEGSISCHGAISELSLFKVGPKKEPKYSILEEPKCYIDL